MNISSKVEMITFTNYLLLPPYIFIYYFQTSKMQQRMSYLKIKLLIDTDQVANTTYTEHINVFKSIN